MECRKSKVQEYQCQVFTANNGAFDACLARELFYLWDMGIRTTGCCCGEHDNCKEYMSYIGVIEENIPHMKALGYEVRINEMDKTREDSFIPKTILKINYRRIK